MAQGYIFTETIDHSSLASIKRIRKNTAIDRHYENAVVSSYRRNYSDTTLENIEPPLESQLNHSNINEPIEENHRIQPQKTRKK